MVVVVYIVVVEVVVVVAVVVIVVVICSCCRRNRWLRSRCVCCVCQGGLQGTRARHFRYRAWVMDETNACCGLQEESQSHSTCTWFVIVVVVGSRIAVRVVVTVQEAEVVLAVESAGH